MTVGDRYGIPSAAPHHLRPSRTRSFPGNRNTVLMNRRNIRMPAAVSGVGVLACLAPRLIPRAIGWRRIIIVTDHAMRDVLERREYNHGEQRDAESDDVVSQSRRHTDCTGEPHARACREPSHIPA